MASSVTDFHRGAPWGALERPSIHAVAAIPLAELIHARRIAMAVAPHVVLARLAYCADLAVEGAVLAIDR